MGFLRRLSPISVETSAVRANLGACSYSTTTKKMSSIESSGFDTIGVVGLGLMGHGICQVSATSGVHSKIVAFEQEQRFLDSG